MRVLVADDCSLTRKRLCALLEKRGYDALAVEDGQQAWNTLVRGGFQLTILDWMMPGLTGPEVCRKIRDDDDLSLVYPIILTAKDGKEDIAEALEAGANDYIVKPFQDGDLIARLNVAQRIVTLQNEFARIARLASIGELAAGITHEINTPLQYVGDNTRFLQEGAEGMRKFVGAFNECRCNAAPMRFDEEFIKSLQLAYEQNDIEFLVEEMPNAARQSLEGIQRVASIVQAMKTFCHPGSGEKTQYDIAQAIQTTVTVARNEWKHVAEMELDLDPALPPVPCYAAEINQVLLNLIVNAAHAVAERVGRGSESKGKIKVSTRRDGSSAEIRVCDSGVGIPEEIRGKIFAPFFTTKKSGKGTGQGLAIARRVIVEKHGGTIDVESELGLGTTFIVRIPLPDDANCQAQIVQSGEAI